MGSMPSSDRSMLAEKVTHVEPQADWSFYSMFVVAVVYWRW
jgi:hypothetical protein